MVVVGLVVVGKQEVASPLPPRHYATPTTSASGPQPPGHVKPPAIAGELESSGMMIIFFVVIHTYISYKQSLVVIRFVSCLGKSPFCKGIYDAVALRETSVSNRERKESRWGRVIIIGNSYFEESIYSLALPISSSVFRKPSKGPGRYM